MDIENEVNFFDTLMKRYSPEVISYIDNPSADPYRIITIILLKLEQKGKIRLNEDGKITVLNKNSFDLSESELFVLDRINDDGRLVLYNFLKLKHVIYKEGKKKNVFTSITSKITSSKRYGVIYPIILLPITGIFFSIIAAGLGFNSALKLCLNTLYLSLFFATAYLPWLIYKLEDLERKAFARTDVGDDINVRIDNLKLSLVNDYETFKAWKNFDEFLFILGLDQKEIERFKPCITIYKNDEKNNIKRLGD